MRPIYRDYLSIILPLALSLAVTGCSSPAEKAAAAAERAKAADAAGNLWLAKVEWSKAVGLRDDVAAYWIALAQLNMRSNSYPGAYDAYSHAIELEPNNLEALQNLAELSLAAGRLEDAQKHADKILTLDARNIRGRMVQGYVALRQKRYADADRMADEIRSFYPLEDAPLILKARALFESGKQHEAEDLIERAIPVRGASIGKLDTLLEFYRNTGNQDGLERTYATYVGFQPDNPGMALQYATILYQRGKFAGAEQILVPMLATPQLSEQAADVMIDAGGTQPSENLLAQVPADAPPPVKAAVARVALEKGYSGLAMELMAPFLVGKMSPTLATGASIFAAAALQAGRADTALEVAQRVLDFDKANPRALRVRSEIALERGQLNDALTDARVLVRDQPNEIDNRTLLAKIFEARKDSLQAESTYRQAFNDMPQSEEVLEGYVAFMKRQRRPAAGLDAVRDFAKRNPGSAKGKEALAELCRAAGPSSCTVASATT